MAEAHTTHAKYLWIRLFQMGWDHEQDKETDKRLKRAQMNLIKEVTLSWEMNYKRCTMYWSKGKLSPSLRKKKEKEK